jgi:hypothetical protein
MNFKTAIAFASLLAGVAGAQETVNTSAIFASPLTMGITSGMIDFPVISGAYEHRITESGYSLFIPFQGGYNQHNENTQYAAGMGLGLRKYIGRGFAGSYLTGQTDLLAYKVNKWVYTDTQYDQFGNVVQYGASGDVPTQGYLSITQLSYGYKWSWRQFTLDLSVGGAFYAQRDEKFTNVIAGANVGFPFNKQTFGFR